MRGSNDSTIRRTAVFLSLLPPSAADRRLALSLVAVSIAIFLALLPFAKLPQAQMPAFIPVYQAALFMSDTITAAVLFGQFSIQRTRALLLLAAAYAFTALAVIPHTLSFPGLFAAGGLMGSGPQTTVWLYMLWHGGFPLLVMAYAFTKQDGRQLAAPHAAALGAIAAGIAVVVGFALLTTVGHALLPTLLRPDNSYTPAMQAVVTGVWALSGLTLPVLWWRRPHTVLDLWLMVVMVAWICDVGLSAALNARRFDLGFYTGRIFGLAAASFVLIMLLLETRALYARLAQSLDSQRAAAEDRADRAQRTSIETAETLRAVVNTSRQAVIALSPQGRVLLWNRMAERMFGYSSDEVVGKPYPLVPVTAAAEQRALFTRLLGGETLNDLTLRRRHKDGSERDIHGAATPFYDASGKLRGIAVALEDVTEKLATEQMLRQAQKMEAVGQLTGGVAHDFNNILMVILANVEELQEDESLSPLRREQLDNIAASAQRAADLTRRLLAFSRKQHLQPQPTNLGELVAGVSKMLRRTLGEQIQVEAIIADDLGTVNIDRAQLEAALVNLCVNSRDAMPGGGRLLIEAADAELDRHYATLNSGVVPGQYVMLAVSDTGTGIPAELLGNVFDPFFTTKGVGKGTGLGLSMVYGFIRQSNGHIKIYSEVGEGTTVRLYIPRSDAAAPREGAPAMPVMQRGSERILVVEDDPQVRAAVVEQVRSLGYAVTEAGGGQAALDRLETGETFALMLTDVVMPGIDGPQLARTAAVRWPAMKIVFMSGFSENAATSHGRVASGATVLSKPFHKIDLARRLREALDPPQPARPRAFAQTEPEPLE